ncbi:MAG TPA: HAMP domain-containing protein [Candidatus Acetothermia bacterium]|nr:HAMP domain-containing protein [Candidatus Acetothermia bacterium]
MGLGIDLQENNSMSHRRLPFALKLGLSFVVVILVAVALVYFMTAQTITARFAAYNEQAREQTAHQLCGLLAEYRLRTGNWFGAEKLLFTQYTIAVNGQLIVRRTSLVGGDFSLADENRIVVVSTHQEKIGTQLSKAEVATGYPIREGSTQIGTLIIDNSNSPLPPAEEEFLFSAKRSALVGGGIASGVALLLSVVLITQVLSPLRLLTRATERIAHGDLSYRVMLRARDEFGRLGDSFNRMIDNLSRSETVRKTMTADIAHELRTPVTIIQGNLEAILDGVYPAATETIAPIYEETLHLGRLIDDLRDLALAESGELRLSKEPTDIVALVNQVVETVNASLENGLRVAVSAPDDIPAVPIDSVRMRQVLANLLSNALRYTPSDMEIRVEIEVWENMLVLRVLDRGPGIPEDELPHIFERFYRGDEARTRAAGGSGLGLAIAKQWVEAHGGKITASNRSEGGACFTILLPIA